MSRNWNHNFPDINVWHYLQELKNTEAGQSKVDAAREQMFSQGFYAAPERHQPHYQQPQDSQQNPQSDQQAPGREGTSTCVHR